MKFWGTLLCISMLVGGPMMSAQAGHTPSLWRDTGLDFDFVEERVNTQACYESQLAFLSCIGAIQGALDLHRERLRLVVETSRATDHDTAQVRGQFGPVAVVEEHGQDFVAPGNALALLRDRSRAILKWRELYPTPAEDRVDFTALRNWLLAEVVESARVEDYAAAAINGYLRITDAHARIVPKRSLGGSPAFSEPWRRSGKVGSVDTSGIGASVQGAGGAVIVSGLTRLGAAARAGVHIHDVILAIDGEATAGLSPESVLARLQGPRHTSVMLTVKHQDKLRTLTVSRDDMSARNVYARAFVDRGRQYAYLRIDSFTGVGTCAEVQREVGRLLKPGLNGLILDLRDNAGGLIDQAVCVADMFLPADELVLVMRDVDEVGRKRSFRTRYRQLTDVPLVILVSHATGSASEVLAGALQDHQRGFVVGERTFGKGTVQTARPWNDSDSILQFYTAARFYRPSGVGVQLAGIQPDLEAHERPYSMANNRIVLREGDLFATALPPEPAVWKQPRKQEVAALSACMNHDGLAKDRWRLDGKQGRVSDYPMYLAQDTLACMRQQGIH